MFLAMIITMVIAYVATLSKSFVSIAVSDLMFYVSIGCGLVWLAMILTGKGKSVK